MERHRCKICFRNFINGRALGGHMRSHTISFSKQVEEVHSCSSLQGEVVENDREDCKAEAEMEMDLSCLERLSRSSPSSSVSDMTTKEDIARCLMMMSGDRWERRNGKGGGDDDDDSQDSSHPGGRAVKRAKAVRGKYRCETCNKLFKSYQALGGHRASYGKIKVDVAAGLLPPSYEAAATDEKVHDCPFCHRVFASGQALGGHKRSHFMGASHVRTFSKNIGENLNIDLNLPAPIDDEINFIGN